MKQIGKLKQYKNYFVLFTGIILLFVIIQISNIMNTMYIDYLGDRVKANDSLLIRKENQHYISYKYIKDNIDSDIYFDNISKKVVISSENGLYKAKINDKNISINFENKFLNNEAILERENKYISLEFIKEAYNINSTVCNNTIYLYNDNECEGKAKYSNISIYKENNSNRNIVDYVDKKDKINVLFEKEDFVFVKVNDKYVGYVLKNALKYNLKKEDSKEEKIKNNIYFFADGNSKNINMDLDITGVIVDMFNITKLSGEINEKNVNKEFVDNVRVKKYKVYGMLNNGYDLTGFNTSTTSQILFDEAKRINVINNLNDKVKKYNLDGVVIDFRKLKEKDIQNYIQFIKEIKAFTKKDVIVNINSDEYKLYIPVINYTDFSVVNTYGQRDLKSTVAGSVSEISWMKAIINVCLKKSNNKKIVIGVPAYSILWTEKNSNVIDSEIYNLKVMQNFIEKNKLELKNVNGQNYVELKKGSLLYRMWIEDKFSINKRLEMIKEKEFFGVAVYKLGYEDNNLISTLKNNY